MISFVRQTAAVMLLAFSLGLSGCGSDDDPAGPPTGPPASDDPVATTSVEVRDNFFQPSAIAVSPEATVTWTWEGSEPHDVTWTGDVDLDDSPTQTSGSFQLAMPAAEGQYSYFCTVHGSVMSGTVHVEN